MANTPQRNESLNALSKDIVARDPELQKLLKGLVRQSIAVALFTMEHGSMSDKMALMKTLTPHMLEALRQTQTTEADVEQRKAYDRLREQMRGET